MRATAAPGLVQWLLAHEAGEAQDQQILIEAAERACEKLRIHLSTRIGPEGYRTLLTRALHLAKAQFPHLNSVRVESDGTLRGLSSAAPNGNQHSGGEEASHSQQMRSAGAVALVTHLFELLVTLIGEDLTWRILSTVWSPLKGDGLAGTDKEGDAPNQEGESL